jgi:hypothetical protein
MAYLILVIDCPNDTIAQLNPQIQEPTLAREAMQNMKNLITAIEGGAKAGSIQATVRDSDPGVTTSGTGSTQDTYSNL